MQTYMSDTDTTSANVEVSCGWESGVMRGIHEPSIAKQADLLLVIRLHGLDGGGKLVVAQGLTEVLQNVRDLLHTHELHTRKRVSQCRQDVDSRVRTPLLWRSKVERASAQSEPSVVGCAHDVWVIKH